jgi:hypothetical protein
MRPKTSYWPVAIDPQHLLEQADRLAAAPSQGRPRGIDLRRAFSAAYYALFHFTMRAAADAIVPANKRSTAEYTRIHRTSDHRNLREFCAAVKGKTLPAKYVAHGPSGGFSAEIRDFATALIELQEKRISADYGPQYRPTRSDAIASISTEDRD